MYATFGPTMSATPQLAVKIGANLAPSEHYLKPDDPTKGHHKRIMSNKAPLPCHDLFGTMTAKAKKAPMCSMNLIAIELQGLAAPGEALKII